VGKLISKYKISDVDLYKLGRVETKKKSSSWFEKEKLKAVTLKILKPYNVSFMDLGNLGSEIKKGNFDAQYSEIVSEEEKLEIENMIENTSNNWTKFYTEWWSERTKNQKIAIAAILFLGVVFTFSAGGGPSYEEDKLIVSELDCSTSWQLSWYSSGQASAIVSSFENIANGEKPKEYWTAKRGKDWIYYNGHTLDKGAFWNVKVPANEEYYDCWKKGWYDGIEDRY